MKHFTVKAIKKLMLITLPMSMLVGLSGCDRTPEERADKFAARISSKLDLNESQEALLNTLKETALKASIDLQGSKDVMHKDFINLMSLNSIEPTELEEFTGQNITLLHQNIKRIMPSFIAFHASLDEEQKEKVIAFISKHRRDGH